MQTLDLRLGLVAFALGGVANVVADVTPLAVMRGLNLAGVAAGLVGLGAVHALGAREAGLAGALAYGLAMLGLTGIAGFLFADAVILPQLPAATVAELTSGPAGLAIFAAVVLYVAGTLALVAALWRAGRTPRGALAVWAAGTVPTLAAIALPPVVMTLAEAAVGLAMVWIAAALWPRRQGAG